MTVVHPDALTLAELLLADWPAVRLRIRASGHPTCEGDPDPANTPPDPAEPPPDPADPPDPDPPDPDPDPDPNAKPPTAAELARWKRDARKWEDRAKRNLAAREEAEKKLKERDDEGKSEQEKAVAAAARDARDSALSEAAKERRADKIEAAVVKLGGLRGVVVGSGDDAKTVKFADPDDAQMWLERQIETGAIDADDIYKDGKVDEEALAGELAQLAEKKPGWLANAKKDNGGTPAGDADGGRGGAAPANSVEKDLAAIRRRAPAATT